MLYKAIESRHFLSMHQDREVQVHNYSQIYDSSSQVGLHSVLVGKKISELCHSSYHPVSLNRPGWGIPGCQVRSPVSYLPPIFLVSSPTLTIQQISCYCSWTSTSGWIGYLKFSVTRFSWLTLKKGLYSRLEQTIIAQVYKQMLWKNMSPRFHLYTCEKINWSLYTSGQGEQVIAFLKWTA